MGNPERFATFALSLLLVLGLGLGSAQAQEPPQPLDGNCCGCNGTIKFRQDTKPDLIRIGTRIFPTASVNPFDDGFTFTLSNSSGSLFSETLSPGVVTEKPNGRRWVYKNPAAPASGGIHTMTMQEMNGPAGGYIVYVRAYTDLSAATEAEMTTGIVVGSSSFFDNSDWNPRKSGWRHVFW